MRLPTSTPSAVPGNMRWNTTSAGIAKIPTSAAAMKPRIDRLSTTRPKKPLRSPGTNQRSLACRVLLVMESFLRGCAARPHPPPAFAGAGSSGTFSRYAGEGSGIAPLLRSGRGVGVRARSELRGEIHADRARFVDEAGQVVEVDAADDARGVGDVAAEQRHFVVAVAPVVADAQAALERGRSEEHTS